MFKNKNINNKPADKKVDKALDELSSNVWLVTKRKVTEWRLLIVVFFFIGALSVVVWGGDIFNLSFGQQRVVKSTATVSFKDVKGVSYGPYYSNTVETVINKQQDPVPPPDQPTDPTVPIDPPQDPNPVPIDPPSVCADGTVYNSCSSDKPLYCDSKGNLVNDCAQCGCATGYVCQSDGSCAVDDGNRGGLPPVTSPGDNGGGSPDNPVPLPTPDPVPEPPVPGDGDTPTQPDILPIPSDYTGPFNFIILYKNGDVLTEAESSTDKIGQTIYTVNNSVPKGIYNVKIVVDGYKPEMVNNVDVPLVDLDLYNWPDFLIKAFNK